MGQKREVLVILIILLFAAGLFFRDNMEIFAAVSLSGLLMADLFILRKKAGELIAGLEFSRTAEKKIVIRGRGTQIKTDISLGIPGKVRARIKEILPGGSLAEQGSTESPTLTGSGSYHFSYDLSCRAHGINRFGGVDVEISDQFFSREISLRGRRFRSPAIMVYPNPSFLKGSLPAFYGRKTNKKTPLSSDEVKGIREYNTLDDIRLIDWKASAKHDKLYVREYSGLEREINTLFIDLPDTEDIDSGDKLEKTKEITGSLLMSGLFTEQVEIIMISGPNLIGSLKIKNLARDAFDVIDRLKSSARDQHLYRYSPRGYSSRINEGFQSLLAETGGYFFGIKQKHIFEKQIYGLLGPLHSGDTVIVVSAPGGTDTSHLRIIAEIAKIKRLKSGCIVPADRRVNTTASAIFTYGFTEVNVV